MSSIKKSCSEKIINIYRKTPFLESLFNKVLGLRPAIVLKKLQHRCFHMNFAKFHEQFFREYLQIAASVPKNLHRLSWKQSF